MLNKILCYVRYTKTDVFVKNMDKPDLNTVHEAEVK